MNLVYSFMVYSLMIRLAFGCGVEDDRDLGIEINDDYVHAASDSKFFANVYSNGAWKGWRRLYHALCDNFEAGNVDWFNDFRSVTTEWEGISLFNCGTDGLLIESMWYWDGSQNKQLSVWGNGVFGPFVQYCLYNDATQASLESPNTWYSDIFIDGDSSWGGFCKGVTFATSGSYGTVWTGSHPGLPDCSSITNIGQAPLTPATIPKPNKYAPYINTDTDFEEKLVNYLLLVITIAIISNSCLIALVVKSRNAPKPKYEYEKVYESEMK